MARVMWEGWCGSEGVERVMWEKGGARKVVWKGWCGKSGV